MSFLRDMVTRVWGEPVENLQPNVIVDPDNSTYIMHVNSDGSINAGIVSGESTSTAINDGTTTSQKASVSAGGALKVDNSAVTQPVSATSLPLPTGAATSANQSTSNTSLGNIDTSTAASKTDLDAINTILGAAGDSNSTNTHMGRLTKIRDYLAGLVYDNTDRLKVSLYGKNSAAADTALLVNSDGSVQYDLRKVLGSALSITNPDLVESNIQNAIRNAQGFTATTGNRVTATNANLTVGGICVFNPSNSGKNILIFSLIVACTNTSTFSVNAITADEAFSSSITPQNLQLGGAASVVTCDASASGVTASVTAHGTTISQNTYPAANQVEVLSNGAVILLPNGSAHGIAVYPFVTTAANYFSVTCKWIEY